MEAEFAREREMERKESEARAREADRLLKERTREWERHERCAPPRLPPGTTAVTLRLPAAQAVGPLWQSEPAFACAQPVLLHI